MNTCDEKVDLVVNGKPVRVSVGTTIAAAVARAGIERFRRSVSGEARVPLCGMGVCFECRVTIDGTAHCRSCQTLCENGMEVRTDGEPAEGYAAGSEEQGAGREVGGDE